LLDHWQERRDLETQDSVASVTALLGVDARRDG
jgi:hypothetical protein